ncbi:MAG: protein kinase [Elusimicrobiota bacterium]
MPSIRTLALFLASPLLAAAVGQDKGGSPGTAPAAALRPAVKAWIHTDGHVSGLALAPGGKRLFACYWEDENGSRVQEFDIRSGRATKTLSFGRMHTHGGVALSKDGRWLYTSNYYFTYISRVDLSLGKSKGLDVGGVPTAVWAGTLDITPDGNKLIVQLGRDGRDYDMHNDQLSLVDIRGGAFRLIAEIKLDDEPAGHRPGISPDSRYVYVPSFPRRSQSAKLYEVSLNPPYRVARAAAIPARRLHGTAISPRRKRVYVGDMDSLKVHVVDLVSFRVVSSLQLDGEPGTMAVGPDGDSLWVLDRTNRCVRILDISKDPPRLIDTIPNMREEPSDIVFSRENDAAYVSHAGTSGGIAEIALHAAPAAQAAAPAPSAVLAALQTNKAPVAPPATAPPPLKPRLRPPETPLSSFTPMRPEPLIEPQPEPPPRRDMLKYALIGGALLLAAVPLALLKRRRGAAADMDRITAVLRSGTPPSPGELQNLFTAESLVRLSEHTVPGASGALRGEDAVVALFDKAGALQSLLDTCARADLHTPYSTALLRQGKHKEAWSLISRKPVGDLTQQDTLLIFTLNVQLGKPEQARLMLRRVQELNPVRNDPAFYTGIAQLAERSPEGLALATEIRTTLKDAPAPAAPVSAPAGLLAGKYVLGRELGQGGMGVVFAAMDRGLGRPVAVKKMRAEYRSMPAERLRFLSEARTIAQLTHPYIVGIHEVVEDGDDIYLVFDYVDGQPLSQALASRKRLPFEESRRVLNHVCQAVDAAHRCSILHRDLKPANIMLDSNGFAKVLDFGLARAAKDSISRLTHRDVSGTPAYMAPEQHLGQGHRASDIFALGVTLYEMLTGELPYKGPDFLAQKERGKYAPPNFIVSSLPKGIEPLMASVLEPDHKKRVKDALELLEALQRL